MNIFDAHISGSLSVSGSGEISNDLLISGNLTVLGTISGSISGSITNADNAETASHAPNYTLTSSFNTFTASYNTGSFSGSFIGDGSGLYNIPASGVTGLNLNKIISGSVSASISPNNGFEVNTNTTVSGHITPSVDNLYDLGSPTHQWRDVYISSGSLYIDGAKVLSSTTQELTITTDNGQSIKILEGTTDSIILQTADGDIELKSSADGDILLDPTNGKIMLKGPVEILSGQKIQSSVGGTPVVFANDIVVSGSIDITGTIEGINLTDFSSSVHNRLVNLEGSVGSLNTYTGSNNGRVNSLELTTASLNTFTSSIGNTINNVVNNGTLVSGSIQVQLTGTTGYSTFSSSVSDIVGSLSSSVATTTSGISSTVSSLSSSVATTTSGLSSTITNLSSSISSSIGDISSSIATTTSNISSTITNLSSSVATTTSGLNSSIGSLSSSVATTTSNVESRTTSLESKTGSYATTGSNIFKSNQTISGSVIITENLTVFGSSSITYVTSSQLRVEDNVITVNTASPGQRFGGLEVHDSGSVGISTGSLLWDSVNNRWIYQNSSEASYGGGVLLSGPRSSGSLGSELTLTSGRIAKSAGGDHLNDSNITDNGTTVSINSNTQITGSLIVTGGEKISVFGPGGDEGGEILLGKAVTNTTLSGNGVTIDIWQNRLRIFEEGGNNRGAYLDIASLSNGVSTNLLGTAATASYVEYSNVANKPSLVSGSSQISFTGITNVPSGLVSGSSQVLNGSGVWSGSAQLPSGVVSGSSQVLSGTGIWSGSAQLPSGVVSGSSQVLAGTTIHSGAFFNGITVVSGSAQISFGGITGVPSGLVSGSSQITFGSISSIPSGLVSGSSQISFGSISSVPGGLVSGSSQIDLTAITNYSTGIKTRLNAEGVLSGSVQVSYTGLSNIPSGIVSGSAQLTSTFVQKGGDSMSGQLVIASTGTAGAATLKVNTSTSTTFIHSQENFSANMTSGQTNILVVGQAGSTKNAGYLGYNWSSSASNSNFISLGHWGADNLFRIYGDGTVFMGTVTTGTWQGSSISTTYTDAKVTSVSAGTGISVNATTGAVTVTNTITNNNQLTNGAGYITSTATISGAAARLSTKDNRAISPGSDNAAELRFGFTSWNNNNTSPWADYLHLRSYSDGSGGSDNLVMFRKDGIGMRIYQQTYGSSTAYSSYVDVLHSSNYTSYSPSLTGANASGTWGINITGNAGTVGNISASGFWQAGGSWAADLGSNGYTRQIGISYTGGEFAILTNNSQISTLIDGTYFAGEQGGFYSMNTSNQFSSRVGFNRDGSGNASFNASIVPTTNGTLNLGTASARWNTVFTSDLSMSNGIGDYTIVEGEEDLFIYNNKTNKVFKFLLQEVDPSIVPAKKVH